MSQKMTLSKRLEGFRAERPDEWTMDEFARLARSLESQRDELLAALKDLEVSANTVDYCYEKTSDKFAYALLRLKSDAKVAREAIAKAVQP